MVDLYLHSPMCLHSMVLNQLSTLSPLPFFTHTILNAIGFCIHDKSFLLKGPLVALRVSAYLAEGEGHL
jgi:hypothetical protein